MVIRVNRTVLHIGYPKTGTKMLQRQFFPSLEGTTLLARNSRHGDLYRALAQHLTESADDNYVPTLMAALIQEVSSTGERLVVSDEALCGAMYDSRDTWRRTARRLQQLLPDSRVLITVRRQEDLLRSLYAFYVQKGGTASVRRFLRGDARGYPVDFDHFCFDCVIEEYISLFGMDQVCVVAYEQLATDPEAYLTRLADFIRGDSSAATLARRRENVSVSGVSLLVLRGANRLARRSAFNPHPLLGDHDRVRKLRFHLQRVQRRRPPRHDPAFERAAERFGVSNRRLMDLTDLPLGQLGYTVDSGDRSSGTEIPASSR